MAKYTIDDFFAGKVDIRCKNKEQKIAVLEECDKRGVVWNNDKKATGYVPYMPVMGIGSWGNGKLTQSDGHDDRKAVDFDKISIPKCKYYRIVIDCNGDTTKATMTINGKEIKGGRRPSEPGGQVRLEKRRRTGFRSAMEQAQKGNKTLCQSR